jgi:hypothetical protein
MGWRPPRAGYSIATVLRTVLTISAAALAWAVGTWYAYKIFGASAIVILAPLLGVLLARPLINLFADLGYAGKSAALADVQGRWFAHKGQRVDIAQDEDGARWLLSGDVRKILTGLPRDEVLAKQFAERTGTVEEAPGFRIRADALAEYLLKSQDAASLRFKKWIDHEVLGGRHNPRDR